MSKVEMGPKDRAEAIIKDILVNHLPRIEEGLRAGYVDENQILVMYDHAVRARVLKEHHDASNQSEAERLTKAIALVQLRAGTWDGRYDEPEEVLQQIHESCIRTLEGSEPTNE